LNFVVAMAVATLKAALVALFFMNLLYDRKENSVIFFTSFLFLAIFIVLCATDLFFRGDVYVKGPLMAATSGASKLEKPWISTPELIEKGKELYKVQCVSCHGDTGQGNGPAASALNPKPRNFHENAGWKNGRKPTMVFKTLKEGLPPSAMASYATLPVDDRWALVHYVLSLDPTAPEADTPADFAKVGLDPTKKGGGGATEAPTIPVDIAMERIAQPEQSWEKKAVAYHPSLAKLAENPDTLSPAARLYQAKCIECHGPRAQGGIKVQNLGVMTPGAFLVTAPLTSQSASIQSQDAFNKVVNQGLPGNLMPGMGNLSTSELRELNQYIKDISK
jgi:mono/diheme cytochrome c family protein